MTEQKTSDLADLIAEVRHLHTPDADHYCRACFIPMPCPPLSLAHAAADVERWRYEARATVVLDHQHLNEEALQRAIRNAKGETEPPLAVWTTMDRERARLTIDTLESAR